MSRRAQGQLLVFSPDAPLVEADTFTCCHCQRVVAMHDRTGKKVDLGGFCLKCMKPTCGPCVDVDCDPIEAKLRRMESRTRLLTAVGLT